MVTSIVLTNKSNIGISSSNKIKVEDHLISLKDIPFIRYRFEEYGESELEFIKKNKERFKGPVHLAEINLCENIETILNNMDDIEGLAKFVYIPIDDFDIANGIKDETVELINKIGSAYYDRLIIKDKSTCMFPLAASKIKLQIESLTEFKAVDIGICGSSLSFRSDDTPGQACLTAVWARRIMAEYADSDDIVVPSASHECMNCCGCIKYFVVDNDIPAPASNKEKATKKDTGSNSKNTGVNESDNSGNVRKSPKVKRGICWASDL